VPAPPRRDPIDVPTSGDLHDPLQHEELVHELREARSSRLAEFLHEDRIHPEELGDQPSDDARRPATPPS
jgi:hypothetical protein